jgi:hypothetical protein
MTIGAPQQLPILNTKIKTTSTVVHKAKYENWQLDHLSGVSPRPKALLNSFPF